MPANEKALGVVPTPEAYRRITDATVGFENLLGGNLSQLKNLHGQNLVNLLRRPTVALQIAKFKLIDDLAPDKFGVGQKLAFGQVEETDGTYQGRFEWTAAEEDGGQELLYMGAGSETIKAGTEVLAAFTDPGWAVLSVADGGDGDGNTGAGGQCSCEHCIEGEELPDAGDLTDGVHCCWDHLRRSMLSPWKEAPGELIFKYITGNVWLSEPFRGPDCIAAYMDEGSCEYAEGVWDPYTEECTTHNEFRFEIDRSQKPYTMRLVVEKDNGCPKPCLLYKADSARCQCDWVFTLDHDDARASGIALDQLECNACVKPFLVETKSQPFVTCLDIELSGDGVVSFSGIDNGLSSPNIVTCAMDRNITQRLTTGTKTLTDGKVLFAPNTILGVPCTFCQDRNVGNAGYNNTVTVTGGGDNVITPSMVGLDPVGEAESGACDSEFCTSDLWQTVDVRFQCSVEEFYEMVPGELNPVLTMARYGMTIRLAASLRPPQYCFVNQQGISLGTSACCRHTCNPNAVAGGRRFIDSFFTAFVPVTPEGKAQAEAEMMAWLNAAHSMSPIVETSCEEGASALLILHTSGEYEPPPGAPTDDGICGDPCGGGEPGSPTVDPSTGGCCKDGVWYSHWDETQCNNAGGVWNGDEGAGQTACTAIGVCCIVKDTGTVCLETTEGDCDAMALGDPDTLYEFNPGELCSTFECPVKGVCCTPEGECQEGRLELECSGNWYEGKTCSQIGECSAETGVCCCEECADGVTKAQCDAGISCADLEDSGAWLLGLTCAEVGNCSHTLGACCNGTTCSYKSDDSCVASGGTFVGGSCAFDPCEPSGPTGKCCAPNGPEASCATGDECAYQGHMTEAECAALAQNIGGCGSNPTYAWREGCVGNMDCACDGGGTSCCEAAACP